jgi:nucleoid DNA-binding protein
MATKGFKELVLIPALTEQELAVREARAVIDAVFGSIIDVLGRRERVELPIGIFSVKQNSEEQAQRSGQVIEQRKYQVEYAAPPSLPRPKRQKKPTKIEPTEPAQTAPTATEPTATELVAETVPAETVPAKIKPTISELATAAEHIVDFIRENVEQCNWNLFFKELRTGASRCVREELQRTRPQLHELRSLSEAAQVIAECRPQPMPEKPWDHLYACIAWFARWTQRVMPLEVCLEAMRQAKKTLMPGA